MSLEFDRQVIESFRKTREESLIPEERMRIERYYEYAFDAAIRSNLALLEAQGEEIERSDLEGDRYKG